jgi:transcriptional regulator with XRE-family HTH domain
MENGIIQEGSILKGREVKTIRERLGLSQRELAGELGVKRLAIARWEASTRTPDEKSQKKLLQFACLPLLRSSGRQAKEKGLDTNLQVDTKNVSSNQENVSSLDTNNEIVSNDKIATFRPFSKIS